MKGSPILIAWLNAQDKQTNSLSVDVHVTQDHIFIAAPHLAHD